MDEIHDQIMAARDRDGEAESGVMTIAAIQDNPWVAVHAAFPSDPSSDLLAAARASAEACMEVGEEAYGRTRRGGESFALAEENQIPAHEFFEDDLFRASERVDEIAMHQEGRFSQARADYLASFHGVTDQPLTAFERTEAGLTSRGLVIGATTPGARFEAGEMHVAAALLFVGHQAGDAAQDPLRDLIDPKEPAQGGVASDFVSRGNGGTYESPERLGSAEQDEAWLRAVRGIEDLVNPAPTATDAYPPDARTYPGRSL